MNVDVGAAAVVATGGLAAGAFAGLAVGAFTSANLVVAGTALAETAAINPIRDTLFYNNPDMYYLAETIVTMGATQGTQMINQNNAYYSASVGKQSQSTPPTTIGNGGQNNQSGGSGAESGNNTTKVGRWMSEDEYKKMLETQQVQMSRDNKVHVANPADIDAFSKQAPKGSVYVEFDVPDNTVFPGGKDGWGIIAGPGSLYDRLNEKKGLPPIQEMPKATNIELKGKK